MANTKYVYIGRFEQETNDMIYSSPVIDMKPAKFDVHTGGWKVWVHKDNERVFDVVALHCRDDINNRTKGYNTYVEAYNKLIGQNQIVWENTAIVCSENGVVMLYDAKHLMTDESWCKAYIDVAFKYGVMTVKSGVLTKTFSEKDNFNIATFKYEDKISGVRIKLNIEN